MIWKEFYLFKKKELGDKSNFLQPYHEINEISSKVINKKERSKGLIPYSR